MSERMVQQAIDRLMVGKTSIVIAHRLATVQHADRILVMDKGQVVGSGDHASLMKSDTLYREYAELQLLLNRLWCYTVQTTRSTIDYKTYVLVIQNKGPAAFSAQVPITLRV